MSVWSWMLLLSLLPAASSLDVENWLTPIVEKIRTEYNERNQFCVAVNIPINQDPEKLDEVLKNDRYVTNVKQFNESKVYTGTNVVAALPHDGHAEAHVLHNMYSLTEHTQNKFLVFYTYLSPCATQCTRKHDGNNILNEIKDTIPLWKEHALVFGRPCTRIQNCNINRKQLENSFKELYKYGFKNIFRCYVPINVFRCFNCFLDEDEVVDECLEGAEPEQGGSAGSSQGVSAGGKRNPAEGAGSSAASKRHKGLK